LSPTRPVSNGANGQANSVVLGPKDRLVGQLFIEGDLHVSGAVTAYNRLVVGSDASLIGGDVRVARLTVEDGATFSGKVSMGKPEPKVVEPEQVVQPKTKRR